MQARLVESCCKFTVFGIYQWTHRDCFRDKHTSRLLAEPLLEPAVH